MNAGRQHLCKSTSTMPNKQHTSLGFTILETMIVIAVTGVLFVSFVILTNGKQNRADFQQALNAVKGGLEQTLSETQSGYYPSSGNFDCQLSGGTLTFGSTATDQGTNADCVFLGKAVQFTSTGSSYSVYSLAGRRDAVDFASSIPTVIPNSTETKLLRNGLTVRSMNYGGTPIGAVAFVYSFGSNDGGSTFGGSQTSQIVPINTSTLASASPAVIESNIVSSYASSRNPSGGVQICFVSGATSTLSGLVTVGLSGGSNAVTLDVKSSPDCT